MHITIIANPEYNESDIPINYMFYKKFPIQAHVSKKDILTLEIIASYGIDNEPLTQHGFIWQCPLETFVSEDDFNQLLDKTFNKSLPETENVQIEDPVMAAELSEYQLYRLSVLPCVDLNQPETYEAFRVEFIKNIRDSDTDTHFYFKKCNGKFFYNLNQEFIQEIEHMAITERKITDNFMIILDEIKHMTFKPSKKHIQDITECIHVVFRNYMTHCDPIKILHIFRHHTGCFAMTHLKEELPGSPKNKLIDDLLTEMEIYRSLRIQTIQMP